ncbi:NepR family anti-sigma factor [Novosphingopyxis sp. YJ-S2-01]|uniref:NepR family anti-sigma factor n=1 Tax=Novosphingopyxis sp. YJ-S2-01 TaxID=2794021 RepID=UPI0018DD2A7D|nr:NepR family anti-sigma factor [Novosphingopyxis sp. YJ-S2-01]MBH9536404.1 hypothetical protein [Novosphingopyxis sp. YJ-S2-01]
MTDNVKKDRSVGKAENNRKGDDSASKPKNVDPIQKDSDPIAQALRNAYQSTVDEGVPDDFLDLIKKLD